MEKFKLNTKKGQVVNLITLNLFLYNKKDYLGNVYKEGLFVKKLKIVHQTKIKIVLSDDYVTVLDRKVCLNGA